jgi:hypothetical protein
LVLRPRKMRSGQRFSYLALEPKETRALNAAYHEGIHRDQSNLIPLGFGGLHPNRSRTPGLRPLPPKRHGPHGPDPGAGLPKSSLAPPSASLEKNSPFPPSSSTANSKPAKLPAPVPSPTSSPSWPTQRNSFRSSTLSGTYHGNWGHLRSAYGAICCHRFKPKNIPDDIFLAQILGHKLLGPNASLSVGQSYKDFYIRKP